ncbi:MAG: nucleotide exchange factor GrpE [Crocinitomicaceae bacterium]|nr:nucleotide exchange factor GrpE [Crocinitomicaceae bacterium]
MTTQDENNEELQDNLENETQDQVNADAEETTEETVEEVDELQALNDKYIRLYSDFDNYRKRTIREKADIISSASGEVIKDLLGIMDDFERAIANNENVEDVDSLKEGFKLIYHKMETFLTGKGVEHLEAKEKVFDPEIHEAVTNIPAPTDELKGKVVDVIEKGYTLKGKILRHPKVVVGQ